MSGSRFRIQRQGVHKAIVLNPEPRTLNPKPPNPAIGFYIAITVISGREAKNKTNIVSNTLGFRV